MKSKRLLILEAYEKALEEEGERHYEALKVAKEVCLKSLREDRQGIKKVDKQM